MFCSSQYWSCPNTDSVMCYCMANHFLCSCFYDCVCDMDHESATKPIIITFIVIIIL